MVGKAVCENGEEMASPRKKAGSLHLIDGDSPGGNEVHYTDSTSRWEASELTETGFNEHDG